ncbi:MAG: TIGR03067 domain-containing protein, partial [Planctomycetales bacterium]|nr:TIGR03067 domain-containing protein [Planctomycetales bacterium]
MLRLLAIAVVGLAFFALLLPPAIAEDESEKDLKKMAGDWTPVLMQLNGKKQPEELLKSIKLTIKGNKYNTVVGKEKDEGTLKLDATKEPREMDITSSVGENKG